MTDNPLADEGEMPRSRDASAGDSCGAAAARDEAGSPSRRLPSMSRSAVKTKRKVEEGGEAVCACTASTKSAIRSFWRRIATKSLE